MYIEPSAAANHRYHHHFAEIRHGHSFTGNESAAVYFFELDAVRTKPFGSSGYSSLKTRDLRVHRVGPLLLVRVIKHAGTRSKIPM